MRRYRNQSQTPMIAFDIKLQVTEERWNQWRAFYSEDEIKSAIANVGCNQLDAAASSRAEELTAQAPGCFFKIRTRRD